MLEPWAELQAEFKGCLHNGRQQYVPGFKGNKTSLSHHCALWEPVSLYQTSFLPKNYIVLQSLIRQGYC